MKRVLLVLTLLLSISTYMTAQNYTEVVYLKNGSVIKGVITEQVPNVSLKIRTTDGSLIVCKMDEVEKITKENLRTQNYRQSARTAMKGYKGFADLGYIVDVSDMDASKLQLSTSHGYQFNNYLYLGGGVALDYYTDADKISVPIFADFKVNFINKRITPFADTKFGYSVGDVEGFYSSVGIGVRFGLKGKKAISLKLQYDYQEYNYSYSSSYYYYDDTSNISGIGFKVGFDF